MRVRYRDTWAWGAAGSDAGAVFRSSVLLKRAEATIGVHMCALWSECGFGAANAECCYGAGAPRHYVDESAVWARLDTRVAAAMPRPAAATHARAAAAVEPDAPALDAPAAADGASTTDDETHAVLRAQIAALEKRVAALSAAAAAPPGAAASSSSRAVPSDCARAPTMGAPLPQPSGGSEWDSRHVRWQAAEAPWARTGGGGGGGETVAHAPPREPPIVTCRAARMAGTPVPPHLPGWAVGRAEWPVDGKAARALPFTEAVMTRLQVCSCMCVCVCVCVCVRASLCGDCVCGRIFAVCMSV
jgi:hypothetical protein